MFGFGKKKQAASENSKGAEGAIEESAIEATSKPDSPGEETPKGFLVLE